MNNKTYIGFAAPLPAHLNPKNKSDFYVFSGSEVSHGEIFTAPFRALRVPGFITPEDFANDMFAAAPPQLNGTLTLFPEHYALGQFRYIRPDGTTATARASDVHEIDPPELDAPSAPKAPKRPSTKRPSSPPQEPEGPDMSF